MVINMISMKDVAKLAGVSTTTVSNVINNRGRVGEETRKKIIRIMEEVNYNPNKIAKSLKMNETGTVGVIVEDISVFNAPKIIDGINDYAEENELSILLTNMRLYKKAGNEYPDIKECRKMVTPLFQQLLSHQVEGIIYIGIHLRDVTGLLPETKTPIVYTYCDTRNDFDYSVNYDDEDASYQITEYLIDKGHRKISLISGLINSVSAYARFNGYQKALLDNQLNIDLNLVKTGDWQYSSGYTMTEDLLNQKDKPTAIIAMNDLMAGGAIQAILDKGYKVPEDISVVGFDNREFSNYTTPKITTIDIPLSNMGKKAIELLHRHEKNRKTNKTKYKLNCSLVERETVQAIK